MNSKQLLLTTSLFFSLTAQAQIPGNLIKSMWASSELEHRFGNNQTGGQLPVVYPQNVFSKPPTDASPDNPSYMQTDICSLGGDSGYVALGFYPTILNGPGYDFTVFENVLRVIGGTDTAVFEEWMKVAVSNDGVTWYTFPYDASSGEGLAGRNFTYGNTATYKDPKQSGGDPFDLSVLGLDSAKYVRLTDATELQVSEGGSADLDAVAAIWQVGDNTTQINTISPVNAKLDVSGNTAFYCLSENCSAVEVVDMAGRLVQKTAAYGTAGEVIIPENGLFIIRFTTSKGQVAKKLLIMGN